MRDLADYDRAFGLIDGGLTDELLTGRWPDGRRRRSSDAGRGAQAADLPGVALKAPRITEAAGRLADHARDAGWTHEEYLAAVLDREVAARNASGAQLRIRAAGFARPQDARGVRLGRPTRRPPADRLTGIRWVPDRSPQRRAARPARHRQDPPGHRPGDRRRPPRPPGPVRDRDRVGHPAHRRPPRRPAPQRARPAAALRADHRRRGRLPALRARRREPVLPTRLQPLRTRLADPHLATCPSAAGAASSATRPSPPR